jgi:hypothetical protein
MEQESAVQEPIDVFLVEIFQVVIVHKDAILIAPGAIELIV